MWMYAVDYVHFISSYKSILVSSLKYTHVIAYYPGARKD